MGTPELVLRISLEEYETSRARKKTLKACRRIGATRLMLFNTYGHIEPGHMDREIILHRSGLMREATKEFRAAGLGVGINIMVTIGMNMSPPRAEPLPFNHLVDFDGEVFKETYCPLDAGLREYLAFMYSTYAATEGIDEIWIDDDFRYKNKAGQCFCPLHLTEFGKVTGRTWNREEVAAALAAEGPATNDLAVQWGKMQNRGLLGCAQAIADGVHRANPHARLGFMAVNCSVNYYGGDYLKAMGEILNPDRKGLARPEYGSYSDIDRVSWNAYLPRWSMQRSFRGDYEAWPEMEAWPGTGYNHGAKVAQMKLAWGAVHGFIGSTVNNVRGEGRFGKALLNARGQMEEIAPFVTSNEFIPRGISLELNENTLGLRTAAGILTYEKFAAHVMQRMGLPLWPDGGCGRVITGNSPLARRDELAEFAREGMIVDREAFGILQATGRDDITGGAAMIALSSFPAEERFLKIERNGRASGSVMHVAKISTVRHNLQGFRLPDSSEFTALSRFHDQNGHPLEAGTWTREWGGGKIVVLPYRLNERGGEDAILTGARKAQFETLFEWMCGEKLPVRYGHNEVFDLQVVYRETKSRDRIFLGLANFSLDDAVGFSLYLSALGDAREAEIRVLDNRARWRSFSRKVGPGGRIRISGPLAVPDQEVRVYEIVRK